MSDVFVQVRSDSPEAQPLNDALLHEYNSRYGTEFSPEGAIAEIRRYPPEIFAPPDGCFLLLLRDGRTIGGGAFKFYDARTAEIKRVWTDINYRRQGLAAKVLHQLELQAARQGYTRLYLTTGFRQPEAVGLYLKNGYRHLFELDEDWEKLLKLPFEKDISQLAQTVRHAA